MTKESLTLSHQELNRLSLVESIIAKRITQHQAAIQLRLSTRQVKRLVRAYRLSGAAGLQSKHRGRQPNNAISQSIRQQALALIKQHYDDFSPTFAHQKLTEQHGLVF
jgi:transposase